MQSRIVLDAVVGECVLIFESEFRKCQVLLVGRDTLRLLDLALDHVDGVRVLNVDGDGVACLQRNDDLCE